MNDVELDVSRWQRRIKLQLLNSIVLPVLGSATLVPILLGLATDVSAEWRFALSIALSVFIGIVLYRWAMRKLSLQLGKLQHELQELNDEIDAALKDSTELTKLLEDKANVQRLSKLSPGELSLLHELAIAVQPHFERTYEFLKSIGELMDENQVEAASLQVHILAEKVAREREVYGNLLRVVRDRVEGS